MQAVDIDVTCGRDEIGTSSSCHVVDDGLACLHGCTIHPRIAVDEKRIGIGGVATGQRHESATAVGARKAAAVPARLSAFDPRLQPDLEETGRRGLGIEFGMTDTRTRTHHLHIAGDGTTLVTQTVLMRDRTFTNIGDDLDILMRVEGKAGGWGKLVVVPGDQGAKPAVFRAIHAGKCNVQFGFQPAFFGSGQCGEGTMLDHDTAPVK